jgi:Lon protease-like protein
MGLLNTIPLFPLPLSLLPGESKPLHIFEERYKKLIRDCRKASEDGKPSEFGILFASASGMAKIGTAVGIGKILKEHPDGRVDVLVEGHRRFRLHQLVCQEMYDQGEIEWLVEPNEDWDDTLANEVFQLHRQLLSMTLDNNLPDEFYSGATALSLRMAPACGIDCAQKQKLLEMDTENQRLTYLGQHLKSLVQCVKRVAESGRSLQEFWAIHQFMTKLHGKGDGTPPTPSNNC